MFEGSESTEGDNMCTNISKQRPVIQEYKQNAADGFCYGFYKVRLHFFPTGFYH